MSDDLLLSDDELDELSEGELAEYESILAGELGGTEMDWRWRSKARLSSSRRRASGRRSS